MNILQGIGRWLCAFLMSVALSTWIFVATFQVTLLNRDVVKTWLASSGVYNQALGNIVHVSSDTSTTNSLITEPVLQNALKQTFPASYIQQSTNTAIDAAYNWLDGTAGKINFTIPVQDKASEFSANLATQLEPILAKLPTCGTFTVQNSNGAITCLPRGISAADYAKQLTQLANSNDFLGKPLTQNNFGNNATQYNALPAAAQWNHMLFWLLPIVWAVLGGLYVLLSDSKLRGLGHVGRQATINSAITLLGGLLLWYVSTSIDLSNMLSQGDAEQAAAVHSIVNPLARTILPDLGKALTLFSLIPFALGGLLWVSSFVWRRKLQKVPVLQPQIPPAASQEEVQLPMPASAPHDQPRREPADTPRRFL